MTEFDQGWNAALKAATMAIARAPVFPMEDGGPRADAERIYILEACRIQVEALKRANQQDAK